MPEYLNVPFAEKDQAKLLGARFDWNRKLWYVPAGLDPAPFARWLPAGQDSKRTVMENQGAAMRLQGAESICDDTGQESQHNNAAAADDAPIQGISLSELLRGVTDAVQNAYADGVWTVVEIIEARARGHVYLEVSERNEQGLPIARARAMIWQDVAGRIVPAFEQATGAVLSPGIKLLVLARPTFHVQYGFSLHIEAIDARYTLGYLEARRREIRARLQGEGVFDQNRNLPAPWDFNNILVVAPRDGAGLGDFRHEAQRLHDHGICRFVYVYSRFQGESAPREIIAAIAAGLQEYAGRPGPDAVVLIRGGGPVSDLAWLDDYELSRHICDLPIPVFTGIGHERDSTLPDEVAHSSFGTPSKAIAAIVQRILQRAQESQALAHEVFGTLQEIVRTSRSGLDELDAGITRHALGQIVRAQQDCELLWSGLKSLAREQVHAAGARTSLHMQQIMDNGVAAGRQARMAVDAMLQMILENGAVSARQARKAAAAMLQLVSERSEGVIHNAQNTTQSLLREILGQGPEKTLARGFAIVRHDGRPVCSLDQARGKPSLEIEFRDGRLALTGIQTGPVKAGKQLKISTTG